MKLLRTLQVAARLVGRGTKKMGRSRTTLILEEDFAGCSQARGARHEENGTLAYDTHSGRGLCRLQPGSWGEARRKWDARVRHSCRTRTLQVAARLVGPGTKKNGTLAYDTLVALFSSCRWCAQLARLDCIEIFVRQGGSRTFSASNIPFLFRNAYACW
jgi:hypothetical protein